jgi:hypothetical protein
LSGSARFFNYGAHFFHLDFILAQYERTAEQLQGNVIYFHVSGNCQVLEEILTVRSKK